MNSGASSIASRPAWIQWTVAVFLTYHALAMLHTLVPDWQLISRFAIAAAGDSPTDEEKARVSRFTKKAEVFPPTRPLDGMFRTYRILSGHEAGLADVSPCSSGSRS